jgi:hypothetical protein
MNGRKTTLVLCFACALIVSAFAAQSASAETTAFTCSKEVTTKTWSDAHCDNESGIKEYGHRAIPENTTTSLTVAPGTSKPVMRLRATINGINVELSTENVSGSGSMHNATVGGKMQATGTGTKTYTNVKVTSPAGKGCKVYTDNSGVTGEEGVIHTHEIKGQTTEEMGVKFEPAVAGQPLATFLIEECKGSEALEGLNKTYTVTGSVIGTPTGGEVVFEHAATTAQNTLKINGTIKAGIDGSTTFKGRHFEKPQEEYKALTATTPPYITD